MKKLVIALIFGIAVICPVIKTYAAEISQEVLFEKGSVIVAKGNDASYQDVGEGCIGSEVYNKYIVIKNVSSGYCFSVKNGNKYVFPYTGKYLISGEYEISN